MFDRRSSTFIGPGVRSTKSNTWGLHFDTVRHPSVGTAFVLLRLYLEAFTVEIIMLKKWWILSSNDRRLYDTVITMFITTKQVLCPIPAIVKSTLIIQRGSLANEATGIVLFVSVHSINLYSSLSSHEITIGFVSSLFAYLMYYVHKQIEMNTNKVIMTKLYGVSCCAIVCVIICVVSCCVGFTKIFSVSS